MVKPGRVARINLTTLSVTITDSEDYYRWLGGRGYGSRIVLDEVAGTAASLSADNKLVFATGSLTGTELPGSSRTELVTKNAINSGISYSSGGGNFGPQLKRAGFNALIIEGAAKKPVYLYLLDGQVEIRDASGLWGKSTWDTVDQLRFEISDPGLQVASIGPAGENLVKISCVIIDKAHALAWGGSGAVMGSKNLKAIAVKSSSDKIKAVDPEKFSREVARYSWILNSSSASHALREGGTHGMAGVGGWSGVVPTSVKNLQEEYWEPEKSKCINEKAFRIYEKGRTTCYNCPLCCLHLYEMERKGEMLKCEGMHANSVRGFGSNWDVTDPFAILKAHALCNMLGLDVDGVSSVIAWAVECYEKGLLNRGDTRGIVLSWGDHDILLPLIEDIAHRKGFGEILAEGVYQASLECCRNTADYAMHFKKVGINEQGLRSHKAWSFGMAVSARGGGHLSGSPQTENRQIPEHVSRWLFGISDAGRPTSYRDKGPLVAWYEVYKALIDSLGLCYFAAGWYEVALADINNYVELYNAFLGTELSSAEMWLTGKHIIETEKAFNTVHAGFTRSDDALPERILKEPLTKGPYRGEHFGSDEFEAMLNAYYTFHGWDMQTGLQRAEELREKGFGELADYLISHGYG